MTSGRIAQVALAAVCLLIPGLAEAQSTPGTEVGIHFASMNVAEAGTTSAGVGGRWSAHVSRGFAFEAEFTVFPKDDFRQVSTINGEEVGVIYQRRRVESFFGPKIGARGGRVGVFARVRPGFTRLTDQGVDCLQVCALILIAPPRYTTELALDLGGTVEVYLTSRALARIDIGDTIVRNRSDAPPYSRNATHNLATRVGLGFRF